MIRYLSKLFAFMTIFFLIAAGAAYLTVGYFVKHEQTVIVPDLRGKNLVSVLTLLGDFGLNTRIKGADFSNEIPKNHVMDQDPDPGDVIKTGREVRLVISKGMRVLAMPDLKGLDLQQATLILEKNGLAAGHETRTYHHRIPPDTVIAQYPEAGREVEQGIPVDRLISRGMAPRAVIMPDLTGLFLDEAVVTGENNRLLVEDIKPQYLESKPNNVVLHQEPPAGHHIMEGDVIHLSVNRKPLSGVTESGIGKETTSLFRYRLPPGYLKQRIRIELMAFGATWTLYDELMAPEREVWVLAPAMSMSVVFLYKNNELIISEIYD